MATIDAAGPFTIDIVAAAADADEADHFVAPTEPRA